MKIILSKTIDEVRKEISSGKFDVSDQPTHRLSCCHVIGISRVDYCMDCIILKEMPDRERLKILVFGERNLKGYEDKRSIRYVPRYRVRLIRLEEKLKQGDRVSFINKKGSKITGTIRIREIYCGKKGCSKCPHKIYAYIRYREGKKVKDKYIGVAR